MTFNYVIRMITGSEENSKEKLLKNGGSYRARTCDPMITYHTNFR
jgi:hypothetical protein